jgi:hypothetical protein
MSRALTTAIAVVALMAAAPAVEAKSVSYKGKTKGGHAITFKRSGSTLKSIKTLVPTVCVPTTGGGQSPKAGADIYQPGASFKLGKTGKTKVLQNSTFGYGKHTKNYTFSSKKGKRGKITGKLDVNFSYLVPNLYGGFGSYSIYICRGVTSFSASPR